MIHPQIKGRDAVVRVTCPTCSGDGHFASGAECPTCEGFRTVEPDVAESAPVDRREFFREDRRWALDRDEW